MTQNLHLRNSDASRPQGGAILALAKLFSFIFHPLFLSTYVMGFLIFIHPGVFTGFDSRTKMFRFLTVLLWTGFFPGFFVFIAWRLKLVKSIGMHTIRDRLIPYVLTMFFYWWTWNVFRNLQDSPPVAVRFLLGSFLAICGGWMCNIFFRISMHGLAAGGMLMFFILFALSDAYGSGLYLSAAVLACGIISTSRLIASDHTPFELYSGLAIGMLSEWISWQFYR